MTTFDDRKNAFETKFAHDSEMEFRIIARRNKLLGQWAAAKLGLGADEAADYAKSVVQADFVEAGHEDVFRKVMGDLAGQGTTEAEVRAAMETTLVEARRQLSEAA